MLSLKMLKREKFVFDKYYDDLKKEINKKIKLIKKNKNLTTNTYKFIGEVKNKKPNGWGRLFDVNKKFPKPFRISYGYFTDGELNGPGYVQYGHPLIHIGHFKKNRLYGKGRVLYGTLNKKSKDKTFFGYEGEFKNGVLNGYGIEFSNFGAKVGLLKKGVKNPQIVFKGEWKSGEPNGKGINYYEGVMVCDGSWKNNYAHGECTIQFYGKDTVNGIWRNGKLIKKISEIGNPDAYTRHLFSKITKSMSNQD